jgi:hypothetical protein
MTKSESSRINGAKSHGPATLAGLAKSSRNAVKHGGAATRGILLKSEDPEAFEQLHATCLATYAPDGPAETALVDDMAAARWRMLRLDQVEAGLLDAEMTRQQSDVSAAFGALADESKGLALAGRYQSRQHRIYDRAYKTLRELQKIRLSREPEQPGKIEIGWITPEERLERDLRREAALAACTCGNCTCPARIAMLKLQRDSQNLPNEPTPAARKEVIAVTDETPAAADQIPDPPTDR